MQHDVPHTCKSVGVCMYGHVCMRNKLKLQLLLSNAQCIAVRSGPSPSCVGHSAAGIVLYENLRSRDETLLPLMRATEVARATT